MRTVWIVSEGSPGHVSQSAGLVEAMRAHLPLTSIQVFGRTTARGWQNPLIRALMGKNGRALPSWLLSRVAKVEIPQNAPAPDLIVSSGGKSIIPARTLAQNFKVPYIFIGLRKPFAADWFHTVITHVPMESKEKNAIPVDLIPTPVTPALIAAHGPVEKGTWAMIIGGASRSNPFKERDWSALADGMNALAQRENVRWLLTTSRRTGAAAEHILRKHLNPLALNDAIWWSEQPRRELYQFIARSEVLFVTQDSVTMVTEAVSSGKPVVAVCPNEYRFRNDGFKELYFERLEKRGHIVRSGTGDLHRISLKEANYKLLVCGPLESPVSQLFRRLNWHRQTLTVC